MGKKPSSAPEMVNGNVPRSGRNKVPGGPRHESLWSDALTQHTQMEQEQEMVMREAVQAAGKDFLTVHVMGESHGERSASVSTGGASGPEAKASSMI